MKVAAGAAVLLMACQPVGRVPEGADESLPSSGTPARWAELKGMTYRLPGYPSANVVKLREGRWEGAPQGASGDRESVWLLEHPLLEGDLDNDGQAEAVIVLRQDSGGLGTGVFNYVAVVKRTSLGLDNVATASIGDRVEVRSGRILDGRILLYGLQARESVGLCCPTQAAEWAWVLEGRELKVLPPTQTTPTR